MDNHTLRAEVRGAVQDYIKDLIADRTGKNKGMAVSANDLLVAAKSAGERANRAEANQLLEKFVNPGMAIIKQTCPNVSALGPRKLPETGIVHHVAPIETRPDSALSRPDTAMSRPGTAMSRPGTAVAIPCGIERPATAMELTDVSSQRPKTPIVVPERPKTAQSKRSAAITEEDSHRRIIKDKAPTPCPPPYPRCPSAKPEKKRERHWLTWPRTPAPPATPMHCRSTTPGAQRTWNQEASLPPRAKSVAYMRPRTPVQTLADMHDECVTPAYEGNPADGGLHHTEWNSSTNIHRVATPAEFLPDYHDNMDSPVPMPAEVALNSGPNAPSYMPAFNAWVSNADDYEKQVAYNLLKALGTGTTVTAPTKPRMTKRFQRNNNTINARYKPQNAAGVRTSQTMWDAYQNGYNNPGLGVNGKSVDYDATGTSFKQPRPPKDLRHINSFFMNSQRPYQGSFIINPEWTSEGKSKQFMHTMGTRGAKAHVPPGMRC